MYCVMKNVKFLIFTAFIVVFLSCSTTNAPSFDDDALVEEQTRSETSLNDSSKGGVEATKGHWIVVTDSVSATEVPCDDKSRNDSIPCDTVPKDSIPKDKISKDRIPKGLN